MCAGIFYNRRFAVHDRPGAWNSLLNAALKQRLVGAIVLVALAVIFVPMLLDGAGTRDNIAREVGIPERPTFAEPALDEVAEPVAAETGEPADALDVVAEPEEEGAPESAPTDAPTTVDGTPATADGPSAWAVQTGSFAQRDNAIGQRDSLLDAGFDAYIDAGDTANGRIWRVRVGPIGRETEARSLRDRLETDEGLDGLVVSHP